MATMTTRDSPAEEKVATVAAPTPAASSPMVKRGKWARSQEFRRFLFATFPPLIEYAAATADDGDDADEDEGRGADTTSSSPQKAVKASPEIAEQTTEGSEISVSMPTSIQSVPKPYILDVAGGKGDVGIPLRIRGVDVGIVDPRVVDLANTKLMRNVNFHLSRAGTKTGDALRKRLGIASAPANADEEAPTITLPDIFREWFTSDGKKDSAALADAKQRACVIVGMHPDQATEPILEYSIAHKKPFAIVPCCVFSRESPHRRVKMPKGDSTNAIAGEEEAPSASSASEEEEEVPVESYEQFIEYLVQKGNRMLKEQWAEEASSVSPCSSAAPPTMQRGELPIEGRNIVLYVTGY